MNESGKGKEKEKEMKWVWRVWRDIRKNRKEIDHNWTFLIRTLNTQHSLVWCIASTTWILISVDSSRQSSNLLSYGGSSTPWSPPESSSSHIHRILSCTSPRNPSPSYEVSNRSTSCSRRHWQWKHLLRKSSDSISIDRCTSEGAATTYYLNSSTIENWPQARERW